MHDNIAYPISIHAFHEYTPMYLLYQPSHPRTFPRAANSKHKKPTYTSSTATSKAPHISMLAGKPVRHAPPFVPGQSNRCCQKHWPARLESCTLDRCTSAILWSPNYHKKSNLWGRTFSSFFFLLSRLTTWPLYRWQSWQKSTLNLSQFVRKCHGVNTLMVLCERESEKLR